VIEFKGIYVDKLHSLFGKSEKQLVILKEKVNLNNRKVLSQMAIFEWKILLAFQLENWRANKAA
jgi:hypothetical protein